MNKNSSRVFSGIQPSGEIHIGNYLGAVKKWVEISESHDSIFCIVDNHAITVDYDQSELPKRTFEAALTSMACGLDPNKCTLFVQSQVPEHTELTWLFNTVTPLGSLFRMFQFKEKTRSALHKAMTKKGGGAKASMLHQLKGVGETTQKLVAQLEADISNLNPDGDLDDELVARLNDGLGNMMQHLQVGLGVSGASTALLDYPVLQAADILLYKANLVPVGEDQEQHLELCREIAERFNRRFGNIFPMAERIPGEAPRILGLDGKQKMSKSLGNHIGVLDPPEVVLKKLGGAFTDPRRQRKSDPGRPEVCNVFSLHKFFTPEDSCNEIENDCRTAGIGCFDCKKLLSGSINATIAPIQERAVEFERKPELVLQALEHGKKQCSEIAKKTMEEVRQAMGIGRKTIENAIK
ncbi:MAG: tryptophan--tRNA ligase [Proteobacteria bacterium]|nr:tryptophan--tRNA ligase [Pseudomonadota bacterium]